MITVIDRERIRRAYYIDGKSMRAIAREMGHGYHTIRKALESAEAQPYTLTEPKPAPVLGPYMAQIDELLAEEVNLPRKQRYTTKKIFKLLHAAGYKGSESGLRRYVGRKRQQMKRPDVYIPLQFQPGEAAQVDWGEATVMLAGERQTVQLFVMRLCYSRRTFAMAFPNQKQEAFFTGHIAAFRFFGGVPRTVIYDNLKTAVKKVLKGRNREEQSSFITFRSHYLFESRFANPGAGHEKGGVEHGVKYVRQQFMVPLPQVADYAALNEWLREQCVADDQRRVDRQTETIGVMWAAEKPQLREYPSTDFLPCTSREVTLNRYGQVVFETNRYSVPVDKAQKQLTLRAYPFRIEILNGKEVIAQHQRCHDRQQDILNPLHYLPLLAERPGAFAHAKPMQAWQATWPPLYDELLARLKAEKSEIKAVKEFVQILQLHLEHEAAVVQQSIVQAMTDGMPHLNGVQFCLNRLLDPAPTTQPLAQLPHPFLAEVGQTPPPLQQYDRLLTRVVTA